MPLDGKLLRRPVAAEVSNKSPYIKSKLQRIEKSNAPEQIRQKQKQFARSAVERRLAAEKRGGNKKPRRRGKQTAGKPSVQPGTPVVDTEPAGRMDGDGTSRREEARGALPKDTGFIGRLFGNGDDDIVSPGDD